MRSQRIKRSAGLEAGSVPFRKSADTYKSDQWTVDRPEETLGLAIGVGCIGIFDTDLVHKRTRFSPELCAILGLPAGTEMPYAQASLLFDERDRPALRATVQAAGHPAHQGRWTGEFRILRADGRIRWVSIHGRRHYRGRQAVRSIGAVVDITHLKETEAALRQSELRQRLALEAAQMGTFEADVAASEAIIDAQEARLLGLPEETRVVSVEALRLRVPAEDQAVGDAKLERLRRFGEAYHHEFRLCLPDGSERWLSAHAAIRASRIFGVNFDITERKRAEEALRESEERLRVAVSGAALGIFEQDVKADRTIWINDRMYEIFGRTRADGSLSKQEFLEDYLHPEDAVGFEAARNNALRTGGNFHAAFRIYRKGGSLRWLQIDGKFDLTDTGEPPSRLVGVVADITERKKLEQEAAEFSQRLVSLQEEERQRIAQDLHDSTVQHLVAVHLNLINLRSKSGSGGAEARLWNEVEASMQEAVNELRSFSYLTHPPALHPGGLSQAVRQLMRGYAERSGRSARFGARPSVGRVPVQTQQALLRIVQEALASIHHDLTASHVIVGLRRTAHRLHLTISDNGIAEAVSGDGHAPVGTGRGLLGIRARVQQLGGDLVIRTRPRGTKIHIAVPVGRTSSPRTSDRA